MKKIIAFEDKRSEIKVDPIIAIALDYVNDVIFSDDNIPIAIEDLRQIVIQTKKSKDKQQSEDPVTDVFNQWLLKIHEEIAHRLPALISTASVFQAQCAATDLICEYYGEAVTLRIGFLWSSSV